MSTTPDIAKFIGDNIWWLWIPAGTAVEWTANRLDVGATAWARRRHRKLGHQTEKQALELETARRKMEAEHPRPVEPVCGCTHNLSFHDRKTEQCHEIIPKTKRRCQCRRYIGPEPLPAYYAPDLADLEGS